MPSLRWRPQPVATVGLTIDVVDGTPIDEGNIGPLHSLLQFHPKLQIGVLVGKPSTLAGWRRRFLPTATIGPEAPIKVCGRPGHRQEVRTAAESATGGFPTPDGRIEERTITTPARVHVAIAGATAAGVEFVVNWVVDADQRDAMRADEDHFLASITCS
jgi:hypothetical protein